MNFFIHVIHFFLKIVEYEKENALLKGKVSTKGTAQLKMQAEKLERENKNLQCELSGTFKLNWTVELMSIDIFLNVDKQKRLGNSTKR